MTDFKTEDSLGAKPLDEQVRYLLIIGDHAEAKTFVDDMFKFAPQLDNMRRAVSEYIRCADVPYEDRLDALMRTPECLLTFTGYIFDFDDTEIEKAFPDWMAHGEFNRGEEVDLRTVYFRNTEGIEMVTSNDFEVPKVVVDLCLREGIHGFVFDW